MLRSRFGPLAARLTTQTLFRLQLGRLFSPEHPLSRDEAALLWALLAHNGGHRLLDRLLHYLRERVDLAERWHGALREWPGRLELAWGLQDPVASTAVLDVVVALRPEVPVHRWPDRGHFQQLKDPDAFSATVRSFLEGQA